MEPCNEDKSLNKIETQEGKGKKDEIIERKV